jgi:hypothetical protein
MVAGNQDADVYVVEICKVAFLFEGTLQRRNILLHRHHLRARQLFYQCVTFHVIRMRMAAEENLDVGEMTDRVFYHTTDKLGSAVLVMNASGVVIENNRRLPYGEAWLTEKVVKRVPS